MLVSLTTIPARSNKIDKIIESIVNQTVKASSIVLNIPDEYRRFPEEKVNLSDYTKKHCQINKCKDYGPLTKLLPALELTDEKILTVDDDCILNPHTIEIFNKYIDDFKDSALCLRGRKLRGTNYNNSKLLKCHQIRKPTNVDIITGVWGAVYSNDIIDINELKLNYEDSFLNDDILISYLINKKVIIPMGRQQNAHDNYKINALFDFNCKTNNDKLLKKYFFNK